MVSRNLDYNRTEVIIDHGGEKNNKEYGWLLMPIVQDDPHRSVST